MRRAAPFLLLLLLLAAQGAARAQEAAPFTRLLASAGRESLEGAPGVYVLAEETPAFAVAQGITAKSLQAFSAGRVHAAGVRVLTSDEWMARPDAPVLYVNLLPLADESGTTAVALSVECRQWCVLDRARDRKVFAPTWGGPRVALLPPGELSGALELLAEDLDRFVSDFKAANGTKETELK